MATREQRVSSFYSPYIHQPVMVYHDPYHPMLNYWLMSQTMDTLAMWTYHHRYSMDSARLAGMYAQNAGLQARVAALESQGINRDPNWIPAGVDPDIVYNDNFVATAANPVVTTTTVTGGFLSFLMWSIFFMVITAGLIYLIFMLRF